ERGGEECDPVIADLQKEPVHQSDLHQKPEERRSLEDGGFESTADPVVDCERSRHYGTPAAVSRERAKSIQVGQDAGKITQVADIRVVDYGGAVVEVEIILEVIGVTQRYQHKQTGEPENVFSTHGFRACLVKMKSRW